MFRSSRKCANATAQFATPATWCHMEVNFCFFLATYAAKTFLTTDVTGNLSIAVATDTKSRTSTESYPSELLAQDKALFLRTTATCIFPF